MSGLVRGAAAVGLAFGLAMQPNHLSAEPTLINISQEAFGALPPGIASDLPAVIAIENPSDPYQGYPDHGSIGVGTGVEISLAASNKKGDATTGILTAGHVLQDSNDAPKPTMLGVTGQNPDGRLGACRANTLVVGSRDAEGYHRNS
jgi:hypothetical protein